MDRNALLLLIYRQKYGVALRKESVDRNLIMYRMNCNLSDVALRKESVDRNLVASLLAVGRTGSLSARRAWIEISASDSLSDTSESLSARRAWIEILLWG